MSVSSLIVKDGTDIVPHAKDRSPLLRFRDSTNAARFGNNFLCFGIKNAIKKSILICTKDDAM